MRIFVTGAKGFVGRRLVRRLSESGHVCVGPEEEVDVTRADALGEVLAAQPVDAVVHLAAVSSVALSFGDPLACFRVNFLGTRTLLHAVRSHADGARVLLVGSGDQYGTAGEDARPFRETDPLAPRSPYAWSKATAEWLGGQAARDGLDVVRARAFNHSGAGQADHFVAPSFARQVAEIEAGRREPLLHVGNLESVRDFMDVEDVIEAYVALLDPAVPAAVYNVASGVPTRVGAVLEGLVALSEADPAIEIDPERFRPTDTLVGDSARLREATGWEPRIPLERTLAGLLEEWREKIGSRRG